MPRSRIIKPEFWDDEVLAQSTSRDARLFFVGMWNYSDDYAVIKGNPIWLKSKIFPYDEIKIETFQKWITELEKGKWILPFIVDGAKYYYIRTFAKHQVINRPSQQRNPEPPKQILEGSLNTHGVLTSEIEVEIEVEEKKKEAPSRTKYLDSVMLSEDEYRKLQEAMGQKSLDTGIEKLDYSITVKGGKYKDHYKTLLNWHKRGFTESQNGNQQTKSGADDDYIGKVMRGEM
jgi:hypothetical protein